jgi:hypothetical protein
VSPIAAAVLALALAPPAPPAADAPTRRRLAYAELSRRALANAEGNFVVARTLDPGPSRLAPLEPETSAATATRLSFALKTDVEGGAQAGVTASPFDLVDRGPGWLRPVSLTAAALKDDKVRLGVGYGRTITPSWKGLGDINLKACAWEPTRKTMEDDLQKLRPAFETVCTGVIEAVTAAPPGDKEDLWAKARRACGYGDRSIAATDTLSETLYAIVVTAKNASATGYETERKSLQDWQLPLATSCHASKDIKAGYAQFRWKQARSRWGILFFGDFFPWTRGFIPDPTKPPPDGESEQRQVRGEYALTKGRLDMTLGVGWGKVREARDKPLRAALFPSFSLSMAAFALGPQALVMPDGAPNLDASGKLPPHAVVGLNFKSGRLTGDLPDGQTTPWQSVELMPFLDFKVSEKLSFRIAAPVRAKLAARAEDKAKNIAAQQSLQWTIPFSVATVIKP